MEQWNSTSNRIFYQSDQLKPILAGGTDRWFSFPHFWGRTHFVLQFCSRHFYIYRVSKCKQQVLIDIILRSVMIRNAHTEGEDLQAVFGQYFSNQQGAQLALWLYANEEMNINGLAKYASPFRNNAKKTEFEGKAFDFTSYKLRNVGSNPDETREIETHSQHAFIIRFKEEFQGRLEGLGEPTKHLLKTGIQDEMNSLLFELKSEQVGAGQMSFSEAKTEYLKQLIEKIVEKFYKDNEEGVSDKIISYCGIEPVLTSTLFSSDQAFKNKFKNILYNCKTFIELKKFGGKDIVEERNKLVESISTCLIGLKFSESTSQAICDELIERPLSNIVALRDDLTNKQKESYYKSEFYRRGELKAYAQIRDYENSLEYKVKEDVTKILAEIEELAKNSKDTIENVLKFDLYGLLKINTIKHIKRNIYKVIIEQCPDFLKAFKMVKYQGKTAASLKENEHINQKMALIELFIKIKLPYEEWDVAENKILNRDYSIVDELSLKFEPRHQLWNHIFQNVEPYFHKGEKETDYRTQVQHAMLQALMDTDIGENNSFESILNIINETLDSENYKSESVGELAKGQQRAYDQSLSKCVAFNEYKANKGRDVKEEQYQKSWELKQQIYENNQEDEVQVKYEAIDEFVQKVVQDGGKIPKAYLKFITDLSKLRGDPIVPVAQDPPNLPPNEPEFNKDDLEKKFAELADQLIKNYITINEESQLEKIFIGKYAKNASSMIRRMIETNVFGDQSSSFYGEVGLNSLLMGRFKKQIAKNAASVAGDLNECSKILQKLGSSVLKPQQNPSNVRQDQPSPVKKPAGISDADFKAGAQSFVNKYIATYEQSNLLKAWQKFGKDSAKFVKAIITQNAFTDQSSAFFTGLGFNQLIQKRIKAEFAKNAVWALNELKPLQ